MSTTSFYQTRSAVLFVIFNRPDTTFRVFERIKQTRPAKLYIAADGPRSDNPSDQERCMEARSVIEKIDWPCETKTLLRDENLGCKYGVSTAIDWFFDNEQEGIILEDDCLPSNDFFRFCDLMLERYRNDTRIRHITGCNLQYGKKWGSASYYFSNNVHVWGWAAWKRVWQQYDVELASYNENEIEEQFSKVFPEPLLVESWSEIFEKMKRNEIDTWDYQLGIANFFNNGLCVIPNFNLISNIGFGPNGTHTFSETDRNANIVSEDLPDVIVHPKYILPEKQADMSTWNADFHIERRRKSKAKKDGMIKYQLNKLLKHLK
ncbi:hypothetical protein B0I27_103166 [Arcticibacter pallidicorallinus]|uniref:Nucleotide-diphospho-sugar transferase n=1 Tax=Arcticibacter pallidicorallinus TaxID=1259464 RepID=A0A2T0U700_9SPHI|nr:nucleotide-diphospho-sugar transferase [Arcticibacter pallidicorallinus]PRY53696.1 hypothetical protein B0I27_103166 [Arcticibacter pallidicorallinus]